MSPLGQVIEELTDAQEFFRAIEASKQITRAVPLPVSGTFQHFASREELEAHLKYVQDNSDTLPF